MRTRTTKPWWCDVFEQQRIMLDYSPDEVAMLANGGLDDDRAIAADDYTAIERGEVVPAIDVFEAVAGALWMGITLELSDTVLDEPDQWQDVSPFFFSPGAQPPKMTVSKNDVKRLRDALK